MSVNERYNVTRNRGHGLHLRELCRRLGFSISYGFEHIWLNNLRYEYWQARPLLEVRCLDRCIPVDNRVDWP